MPSFKSLSRALNPLTKIVKSEFAPMQRNFASSSVKINKALSERANQELANRIKEEHTPWVNLRIKYNEMAHSPKFPHVARELQNEILEEGDILRYKTADAMSDLLFFHIQKAITNPHLTEVSLMHKEVHHEGFKRILKLLAKNKTVTTLNLTGTFTGDECVPALIQFLQTNTAVREISLWYNAISEEKIAVIKAALKQYNPVERKITFDYDSKSRFIDVDGAETITFPAVGTKPEITQENSSIPRVWC